MRVILNKFNSQHSNSKTMNEHDHMSMDSNPIHAHVADSPLCVHLVSLRSLLQNLATLTVLLCGCAVLHCCPQLAYALLVHVVAVARLDPLFCQLL